MSNECCNALKKVQENIENIKDCEKFRMDFNYKKNIITWDPISLDDLLSVFEYVVEKDPLLLEYSMNIQKNIDCFHSKKQVDRLLKILERGVEINIECFQYIILQTYDICKKVLIKDGLMLGYMLSDIARKRVDYAVIGKLEIEYFKDFKICELSDEQRVELYMIAVKEDPEALQFIQNDNGVNVIGDDEDLLRVSNDGIDADNKYKDIALEAVKGDGLVLRHMNGLIMDDYFEVAEAAIRQNYVAIEIVKKHYQKETKHIGEHGGGRLIIERDEVLELIELAAGVKLYGSEFEGYADNDSTTTVHDTDQEYGDGSDSDYVDMDEYQQYNYDEYDEYVDNHWRQGEEGWQVDSGGEENWGLY